MDVYKLTKYGGECPDCGEWYEFDDNPDGEEFKCPECNKESEIIIIGE